MWSWTFRSIRRGGLRAALLTVGLLAVTMGSLLVAAASQTTLLTADRELRQYWRGSYDILVRPAGVRSSIEGKYNLVEANHLSGIAGGISSDQYEAVKAIPGVEVAAPIAMLGYEPETVTVGGLGELAEPGAYVLSMTLTADPETCLADGPRLQQHIYYYVGPEASPSGMPLAGVYVNPPPQIVGGTMGFPVLVAGIDPVQEAALVGLDQAVTQGQYLTGDEPIVSRPYPQQFGSEGDPETCLALPTLINTTSYVSLTMGLELSRITLPPQASWSAIVASGGEEYLATLPTEAIASEQLDSSELYARLVQRLTRGESGMIPSLWNVPTQVQYREAVSPSLQPGLALDVVMPGGAEQGACPAYRAWAPFLSEESRTRAGLALSLRGVVDFSRLPQQADLNRVPLETYVPPVATLLYDEAGQAVMPRTLRPGLEPAGYIQPPPLALTTLEAARALRGDDAISAIRVRVGGIEDLGPASQRKIEAVAIEIAKSTGLAVDIVVGSSPTRVLVHVPGIGYVEEQWIKKGVNLVYREGIQAGSWLLIGTILIAGALFTLDLTWSEVLAQRRLIALHKALGWRTRTVMAYLTSRLLLVGAAAVIAGTAGAWGFTRIMGWQVPALPLLLGLPVLVLTLVCVAGLPLIWKASRVPPLAGIRQAGVRATRGSPLPARSLASYGWSSLMRRPARTLLTATASALSAALLVLLLAVTLGQRGMLSGTLLGEFILVRVQEFHYAIVGIGFALAALSTANGLLGSIVERRHEIGILKAVGWRSPSVARLFVLEGLLVGLAGGLVGALLGCSAGLCLYKALSPTWAAMAAAGIGVAGLVGAVAALYPAQLAARVPPAEALRYE